MPQFNVTESNSSATTQVSGTVGSGITILGIARAGKSSAGVGQTIQGTYGSLVLNSNGTFTYLLDNNDADTNVLGAGMVALERFTYTYSQNGVTHTAALVFQVAGINDAGQTSQIVSEPLWVDPGASVAALHQLRSSGQYAILIDPDYGETGSVVNNGAIVSSSTEPETIAMSFWDSPTGPVNIVNNGFIDVLSHELTAAGIYASGGGFIINNGVIEVVADRLYNPNVGAPPGIASGVGGARVINSGTIDVSSAQGDAYGVKSGLVDNSGFIYVSGGTTGDGYDNTWGISSGATGALINNSGTIHVVSPSGTGIGIYLFPDNTNVHQYGTVVNSGTIVADTAILAVEGYSTGIHVTNSGRIEGDLLFNHNLNIVANALGGTWVGDLQFGFDQDVLINKGTIVGTVGLGGGHDLFDGRGGTSSGLVDGGDGNDLMRGGGSADQLAGGAGNDRIYGGGGADTLSGGTGADVFVYSAQPDSTTTVRDTINGFETGIDKIDLTQLAPSSVTISASGGFSIVNANVAGGTLSIRVQGSVSNSDIVTAGELADQYGTSGNDVLETTTGNSDLYGGAGDDVLHGNSGDNYFDGADGNDTLYGGGGNDTYLIINDGDRVIELAGEGIDEVQTWVDYSLQAFVENLRMWGSGNIGALGNQLGNVMTGNSGSNVLRGSGGSDVLIGGLGADGLEGGYDGATDVYLYGSSADSTAAAADHLLGFEHGFDLIDLTAVSPVSYEFIESPSHLYYGPYWASIFVGFTQVNVSTAAGETMTLWVSDRATLGDFLVNAPLKGTDINDVLMGSVHGDQIDGRGGNDTLSGGVGNDVLTGGAGSDVFRDSIANLNGDTITDLVPGESIIFTDATLAGFGFSLSGGTLTYAGGSLTLQGSGGQLVASEAAGGGVKLTLAEAAPTEGDDVLTGTEADDIINGLGGSDTISGLGGNDTLNGGAGDDTLDGGTGADTMIGGIGDDVYYGAFDFGGEDTVTENVGEGIDTVIGSGSYTFLPDNVENLTLVGTGWGGRGNGLANTLTGTDAGNSLNGDAGNDVLFGGGGIDLLTGGDGDDTLNGGAGFDDALYEDATGGVTVDLAISGPQNTIGAGIDTLAGIEGLLGSGFADALSGDDNDNYLFGGFGNDTLIGRGGDDQIEGGRLSDDIVDGGAGNDTALFLTSLEDLTVSLAVAGPQNTGNGVDILISIENLDGGVGHDQLTGDAGSNSLRGRDGNDTLSGGAGSDTLTGDGGNDLLVGGDENDWLTGGSGNDIVDGGAGGDALAGGLGNDRFYIDNIADQLIESLDQGDDIAFVLGTYTLAQGVSVETLVALNQASTDPLVLTGNEFGQSLYGNAGDNYLNGGGGADYLVGLAGNDSLLGGTGADHMQGGTGDDVYYVDNVLDLITELAGEGQDILVATASYTLGAGVAIEVLSTEQNTAAINITGNELAQTLYGNLGDNILTGMGGADYMLGGLGNDKYYVDELDYIGEGAGGGDDWIFVSTSYALRDGNEIETLVAVNQDSLAQVDFSGNEFGQSLYGSQGVNNLNGGGGNDYLVGLGGNDFLFGDAGNDNLAGGTGNDLYYVDSGDQIFEAAGEGDDLAVALQSFALGAGQSVETLSAAEGAGAIDLTGNALAQSLYGNGAANVLTTGGGADYLVGGAGNDVFVLTNAAGIATVADYAAGDVVDLRQYLSLANGTDPVAGGYVKIVGTQLMVDATGGADSWTTIANVGGSGAVTIRYASGGNPADVSVSRSAGQEAAVVSKVALETDAPAHAQLLDDWHAFATDAPPSDTGFDPITPHLAVHGII